VGGRRNHETSQARAQSGKRYDAFVAALGRRLAQGPKLRSEIPEDVFPSDDIALGDTRT
jgi:hypothetical protein